MSVTIDFRNHQDDAEGDQDTSHGVLPRLSSSSSLHEELNDLRRRLVWLAIRQHERDVQKAEEGERSELTASGDGPMQQHSHEEVPWFAPVDTFMTKVVLSETVIRREEYTEAAWRMGVPTFALSSSSSPLPPVAVVATPPSLPPSLSVARLEIASARSREDEDSEDDAEDSVSDDAAGPVRTSLSCRSPHVAAKPSSSVSVALPCTCGVVEVQSCDLTKRTQDDEASTTLVRVRRRETTLHHHHQPSLPHQEPAIRLPHQNDADDPVEVEVGPMRTRWSSPLVGWWIVCGCLMLLHRIRNAWRTAALLWIEWVQPVLVGRRPRTSDLR